MVWYISSTETKANALAREDELMGKSQNQKLPAKRQRKKTCKLDYTSDIVSDGEEVVKKKPKTPKTKRDQRKTSHKKSQTDS